MTLQPSSGGRAWGHRPKDVFHTFGFALLAALVFSLYARGYREADHYRA